MDPHNYPGRGLSLSQLVFALNEELKRVGYSPLFPLEAVSQLDRDASIALAAIREWKNSFIPVNRIPMDILSLIPTHLPTQKDRFHAASVCRHWRGVLLKHGALWSQLFLRKGEECVSTLLERAKGSGLDIIVNSNPPVGTLTQISPRAQQIMYLEFIWNHWQEILTFSESNSGQLPLLRTLKIISPMSPYPHSPPDVVTSPSLSIFRGSINLDQFVFRSWKLSLLSQFTFPNLTTFELGLHSGEESTISYLFDFLKASPMLQTVEIKFSGKVVLWGIPQGTVVVLSNVTTFSLHVASPWSDVYEIAAHISCPLARHTSLAHEIVNTRMSLNLKIFPTPVSWNTIVHQYATSSIKEVTLEIKGSEYDNIECSLTFRSSDATAVRLGFTINEMGVDKDQLNMPRAEMGWEIFFQALTTIRDHPLLSQVKQLQIKYADTMPDTYGVLRMAEEVRELFGSLGSLDKLIIHGCDLRIFLANFLDDPVLHDLEPPIVFPQIKDLAILHPWTEDDEVECIDAITELARSQHTLGIPFEHIKVRNWSIPAGMAEELRQWVGAVDCREEEWG